MSELLEKVLYDEGKIQERVRELGREISRDYEGRDLVLLCVLKGAVIFLSDLTRAITIPHSLDFIGVSSYRSRQNPGHVVITKEVPQDLKGRHVLLVEDIYDTGLSLQTVMRLLEPCEPASVEICAFLHKKMPRDKELAIKYVGFHVPNVFVVGYGLDFNERFRNLPCIGTLKKELKGA